MKLRSPAAARNREPILEVLRSILKPGDAVLEVASGPGEHAVYFASHLPHVSWQPTEHDAACVASIEAWAKDAEVENLRAPLRLDVAGAWVNGVFDAVVCINLLHIAPWGVTSALFKGAASVLRANGCLVVYGPFLRRTVETPATNLAFDQDLRARNPEWGLRELVRVEDAARQVGFVLETVREMPANNLSLVFRFADQSTGTM